MHKPISLKLDPEKNEHLRLVAFLSNPTAQALMGLVVDVLIEQHADEIEQIEAGYATAQALADQATEAYDVARKVAEALRDDHTERTD